MTRSDKGHPPTLLQLQEIPIIHRLWRLPSAMEPMLPLTLGHGLLTTTMMGLSGAKLTELSPSKFQC